MEMGNKFFVGQKVEMVGGFSPTYLSIRVREECPKCKSGLCFNGNPDKCPVGGFYYGFDQLKKEPPFCLVLEDNDRPFVFPVSKKRRY